VDVQVTDGYLGHRTSTNLNKIKKAELHMNVKRPCKAAVTRKAVKARRYLHQGYWFDTACPTKTNKRESGVCSKL